MVRNPNADEVEAVRAQLAALRHGAHVQIAAATGLSRAWLSRFARGQIADPSASRLLLLRDHLKRRR